MQDSSKKVALVTRVNKGIGFEVAHQLAHRTAPFYSVPATKTRGEEAAARLKAGALDVRYLPYDTGNHATIGVTQAMPLLRKAPAARTASTSPAGLVR